MGGSAEVRSEPGVGSTFTINLQVPEGTPSAPDGGRPEFVLIARS